MRTKILSCIILALLLATLLTVGTGSFADQADQSNLSNKKALFIGDSITYGWDRYECYA